MTIILGRLIIFTLLVIDCQRRRRRKNTLYINVGLSQHMVFRFKPHGTRCVSERCMNTHSADST